jgi:hypothetical protein
VKPAFPIGALVYLDGATRVRVVEWWPEGTTTQLGAHYVVRAERETTATLTLADRTGTATDRMRLPAERVRVHPSRVGVRRKRGAA